MRLCERCSESGRTTRAQLRRPRNNDALCKSCFFEVLEKEVQETIVRERCVVPQAPTQPNQTIASV